MNIQRSLLTADSNGRYIALPGDTTQNPNNPVYDPFYTNFSPIIPGHIFIGYESTGIAFVEFWNNNECIGAPVLLQAGMSVYVDANRARVVGVRRAGELWICSGMGNPAQFSNVSQRGTYRGMQLNVFPLTQIPLYAGGPLSNIWCHPNSAPGSATPMVMGTASYQSGAFLIGSVGYNASYWNSIGLCAFNVDPDTQSVVNVRRITSSLASLPSSTGQEFNTWDRLGVLAIPSATNPGVGPGTVFQVGLEGYNTYSRKTEYGFLGVGASGELT